MTRMIFFKKALICLCVHLSFSILFRIKSSKFFKADIPGACRARAFLSPTPLLQFATPTTWQERPACAPRPRIFIRRCTGVRARRLDERETIGCQFVTASQITPHERLSEHGEDDEVHNRAMDTSAGPRVSCLSSPPSVKYSLVSTSVIQTSACVNTQ